MALKIAAYDVFLDESLANLKAPKILNSCINLGKYYRTIFVETQVHSISDFCKKNETLVNFPSSLIIEVIDDRGGAWCW